MKRKKKQADRYRSAIYDMALSEVALLKDDYSIDVALGIMARLVSVLDNPEHTKEHQLVEAFELMKKYRSTYGSTKSLEELINLLLEDR